MRVAQDTRIPEDEGIGGPAPLADAAGMPRALKWGVLACVTLLVAGAAYLIIVRGPAMIIDMAANSLQFICF